MSYRNYMNMQALRNEMSMLEASANETCFVDQILHARHQRKIIRQLQRIQKQAIEMQDEITRMRKNT